MASVSVVIQFFEDFDFIERVVERLAWVDEIVVNDGPFQFTRELLEPLVGRDLEQPSPRAAGLFALLSRRLGVPIHYHHGVFAGEREKRIHGYGLAKGDVVLSVDADELLLLERDSVEHFWASAAVVASFDCVNFTYLNLVCGKAGSPLVARKPFAFKREAITAEHHLNYLWLVGVEQAAVASEDFLPEALCGGAHLTTVRSAYGASIKFGFYNCLYFHLHGERGLEGSFQAARQFLAQGNFDGAAQAEVYGRAMADAIGFPNEQRFRRAEAPEVPEAIRHVAEEACAAFNHSLPHRCLNGRLVPGVPLYALMAAGSSLRVSLAIAGEARLRVLPLLIDGPPLDLGQPAVEQRWAAEALMPHDLQLGDRGADGGERIGDLVELLVWSGEDATAAWAGASLAPSFSLQVVDPGGAGA
ncbi:hypothetical protein [Synechococcus sp. CS-1332]|uniref:hypothetical protein n=1 Tax=Synechococcus sp. CS-1332 TaxID=2847972 RepID=UPI00223A8767|nr:hypothetical protein [Synechococcus sp. CS-1332]MCT0206129.1 hypothetical protein [Synechococcus sp. CS-1332]